jgi:hypothetical protein
MMAHRLFLPRLHMVCLTYCEVYYWTSGAVQAAEAHAYPSLSEVSDRFVPRIHHDVGNFAHCRSQDLANQSQHSSRPIHKRPHVIDRASKLADQILGKEMTLVPDTSKRRVCEMVTARICSQVVPCSSSTRGHYHYGSLDCSGISPRKRLRPRLSFNCVGKELHALWKKEVPS